MRVQNSLHLLTVPSYTIDFLRLAIRKNIIGITPYGRAGPLFEYRVKFNTLTIYSGTKVPSAIHLFIH